MSGWIWTFPEYSKVSPPLFVFSDFLTHQGEPQHQKTKASASDFTAASASVVTAGIPTGAESREGGGDEEAVMMNTEAEGEEMKQAGS